MESTPSDELIHSDQIELLKAAMPYLPRSGQQFASVFAKFLELQETFHVFLEPQGEMQTQDFTPKDPIEMLSACSKVCHGPAKEKIDTLLNTMALIQIFELSQEKFTR